jgi:uncharacterized protein
VARVQRFDVGAVRGVQRTPQGGVRVEAAVSRTGILEYVDSSGAVTREYRPDSEVFAPESLATIKDAPVTDGHPPPGVVHAANYREYSRGHVAQDVHQDGDKVAATLVVQDGDMVKRIESGELREVSVGYTAEIVRVPGVTPSGERYDAIQTAIRANHCALGPAGWGRSGPEVALRLDGGAAMQVMPERSVPSLPGAGTPVPPGSGAGTVRLDTQEKRMPLKLKFKGKEYRCDAPDEMAVAQNEVDAVEKKDEDIGAELSACKDALAAALSKIMVLEAKQQALAKPAEPAPEVLDSWFEKRPDLFAPLLKKTEVVRENARKLLGTDVKLDGLSVREIHEAAVRKVLGVEKLDGLSADYVKGLFDGAVKEVAKRNDALGDVNVAANGGASSTRTDADDDEDPAEKAKRRRAEKWSNR